MQLTHIFSVVRQCVKGYKASEGLAGMLTTGKDTSIQWLLDYSFVMGPPEDSRNVDREDSEDLEVLGIILYEK